MNTELLTLTTATMHLEALMETAVRDESESLPTEPRLDVTLVVNERKSATREGPSARIAYEASLNVLAMEQNHHQGSRRASLVLD